MQCDRGCMPVHLDDRFACSSPCVVWKHWRAGLRMGEHGHGACLQVMGFILVMIVFTPVAWTMAASPLALRHREMGHNGLDVIPMKIWHDGVNSAVLYPLNNNSSNISGTILDLVPAIKTRLPETDDWLAHHHSPPPPANPIAMASMLKAPLIEIYLMGWTEYPLEWFLKVAGVWYRGTSSGGEKGKLPQTGRACFTADMRREAAIGPRIGCVLAALLLLSYPTLICIIGLCCLPTQIGVRMTHVIHHVIFYFVALQGDMHIFGVAGCPGSRQPHKFNVSHLNMEPESNRRPLFLPPLLAPLKIHLHSPASPVMDSVCPPLSISGFYPFCSGISRINFLITNLFTGANHSGFDIAINEEWRARRRAACSKGNSLLSITSKTDIHSWKCL